MIEAHSPGKLYIVGEYAVLEPGEPAILIAVDRYLSVRLTESTDRGRVFSTEYGHLPMVWRLSHHTGRVIPEHHPYDYVAAAINTVEQVRAARKLTPRYFDLRIESQLDDENGQKFGLGSSGAVVTATIDALNQFYDLGLSAAERFQLALLATIHLSPKASGGDLAASTFGGWISYRAPSRERLREVLDNDGVVAALDPELWRGCRVDPLPNPAAFELYVGWTGSPASTDALVDQVQHRPQETSLSYGEFVAASRDIVERLTDSLHRGEAHVTLQAVREARSLLRALGETSGLNIETEKLAQLCNIAETNNAAAKPSGAGGGDCGIAFVSDESNAHDLLSQWDQHHIHRLSLRVHPGEGKGVDFG